MIFSWKSNRASIEIIDIFSQMITSYSLFSLLILFFPGKISALKDLNHLRFIDGLKQTNETGIQLFCGNLLPRLLQSEKEDIRDSSDSSFVDYHHGYEQRKIQMRKDEREGVVFEELEFHPYFQIQDFSPMLYCSAWNRTHEMPHQASIRDLGQLKKANKNYELLWTSPQLNFKKLHCGNELEVQGKLYLIANWFPGNYGHFLHDTLPLLNWIATYKLDFDKDKIGLIDTLLHRNLLTWLYPELYERILWFEPGPRVNCLAKGTLVAVQSATADKDTGLLVRKEKPIRVWSLRNPSLFRNVALMISKQKDHNLPYDNLVAYPSPTSSATTTTSGTSPPPPPPATSLLKPYHGKERSIVFYSRRSKSTFHGRIFSEEFQELIVDKIRNMIKTHNRPEKLVIFNGENEYGNLLSFEEQFRIFRNAILVIGPHGSGLANTLWLAPSFAAGGDCSASPIVLEIIADTSTSKTGVQTGGSGKSYFNLMGGVPWIRYYHIFLATNSTNDALFINLDVMTHAMNRISSLLPPI